MEDIGALARSFFEYAVQVGGLPFALVSVFCALLWMENRQLKKRINELSDGLIEDGRDATEKLIEMSASKMMNESSTASALAQLAKALGEDSPRRLGS